MRRFKAILSLLLILTIVLPCCAAHGETCYVFLRDLLSADKEAKWYMGEGLRTSKNMNGDVNIIYMINNNMLVLSGVNEEGIGEAVIWGDAPLGTSVSVLYRICSCWETLEELLDEGTSLTLSLIESPDSKEGTYIRDAESAKAFADIMIDKIHAADQEEALPESEKQGE